MEHDLEPEPAPAPRSLPEGVPPAGAGGRRRAPLRARLQERRRATVADAVERTRERLLELEQKEIEAQELSELQAQYAAYSRIWALDRHPPPKRRKHG